MEAKTTWLIRWIVSDVVEGLFVGPFLLEPGTNVMFSKTAVTAVILTYSC